MPEFTYPMLFVGLLVALVVRRIVNRRYGPRSMPFLGTALVVIFAGYTVLPAVGWGLDKWRTTSGLPYVSFGMIFIGLWVGLIMFTAFETKGQPRRVPIWAVIVTAVFGAFAIPYAVDRATGAFQNASLRADVNQCRVGLPGTFDPRAVTNACDYAITVGLCLPGETNPDPCEQSITLGPGEQAQFETRGARLSSLPANPNGFTVVACRPPDRPSRTLSVLGRGYDGVCIPAG